MFLLSSSIWSKMKGKIVTLFIWSQSHEYFDCCIKLYSYIQPDIYHVYESILEQITLIAVTSISPKYHLTKINTKIYNLFIV